MIKHFNIKVYGRVQGVFFRQITKERAEELGITGFVRNEPNGSVYAEAEGEEEKLKEFLVWCQGGPRWAEVEKVEHETGGETRGFKEFVILIKLTPSFFVSIIIIIIS